MGRVVVGLAGLEIQRRTVLRRSTTENRRFGRGTSRDRFRDIRARLGDADGLDSAGAVASGQELRTLIVRRPCLPVSPWGASGVPIPPRAETRVPDIGRPEHRFDAASTLLTAR